MGNNLYFGDQDIPLHINITANGLEIEGKYKLCGWQNNRPLYMKYPVGDVAEIFISFTTGRWVIGYGKNRDPKTIHKQGIEWIFDTTRFHVWSESQINNPVAVSKNTEWTMEWCDCGKLSTKITGIKIGIQKVKE